MRGISAVSASLCKSHLELTALNSNTDSCAGFRAPESGLQLCVLRQRQRHLELNLVKAFEVQLLVKSVAVLDLHPSGGLELQEELLSLGGGQPVCGLDTALDHTSAPSHSPQEDAAFPQVFRFSSRCDYRAQTVRCIIYMFMHS